MPRARPLLVAEAHQRRIAEMLIISKKTVERDRVALTRYA